MITTEQVAFFHGFGFVVVDDLVASDILDDLTVEVGSALDEAFGEDPRNKIQSYLAGRGGPRPGAVLGHYLPIMSSSTPRSLYLAESDNLIDASQQILGTRTLIAKPAKAVRYFTSSGWHHDCGSGLSAVKFIYYLESADDITFELIPASHLAPLDRIVPELLDSQKNEEKRRGSALDIPSVTVRLKRHQALIFDVALWHRNNSDSERTQWSITYIAGPNDAEGLHDTVSFIGSFFGKHPSYDKQKFPFFPDCWIDGSSDSFLSQNLNQSGVMEQFVERFGRFL